MTNKERCLEYKVTLKETSNLLTAACQATKRRSTVQWIQQSYKIGTKTKEQYISALNHVIDTKS